MPAYEAKDLKEQFEELGRLKDFTLVPLIDVIKDRFFESINENPLAYEITDFMSVEASGEGGLYEYVHDTYNVVLNGKTVQLRIFRTDIDAVDEDEYWWMVWRIVFGGNEEAANKLCNSLKGFVRQQELSDLVKEAAERLGKGKTYHLTKEMSDFYLRCAYTLADY